MRARRGHGYAFRAGGKGAFVQQGLESKTMLHMPKHTDSLCETWVGPLTARLEKKYICETSAMAMKMESRVPKFGPIF